MNSSLSLKALLRTPFKAAMTLLLIALASFALFARIADYSVTAREMKKVENSYNGVIALDNGIPPTNGNKFKASNLPMTMSIRDFGNPYVPQKEAAALTAEQINAFLALPDATAETRYMTGGVIEDIQRLNPFISLGYDWGYDYGARFIMEGTFEGYSETLMLLGGGLSLKFSDAKQLAGRIYDSDSDGTITLLAGTVGAEAFTLTTDYGLYSVFFLLPYGEHATASSIFTPQANSTFVFADDPYREEFAESLVPGTRYLFIGRYIPNTFDLPTYDAEIEKEKKRILDDIKIIAANAENSEGAKAAAELLAAFESGEVSVMPFEEMVERFKGNPRYGEYYIDGLIELVSGKQIMRLGDYDTYDYCPSFMEVTDTENTVRAMELADITNQDLHTFDIVYASNMAAIPRFNERKMMITSGRAIVPEDGDVCVISQYIADAYGFKLGDKITIGLGDRLFEQYAQMGAIAYIPERRWNVEKTTEFEIIGVYKDIDAQSDRNSDMYMGYSPNTIFVPLSRLPVDIPSEHAIKPGEFSLFISNPADFEKILESAETIAAETGVKLRASDGGYANVKDSIKESRRASLITMCLYIFASALALTLSAYLHIGRGRKTYAIMRALGTPVNKSRNSLILPLGLLIAVAIPLGGIIGLVYTSNAMETVLNSFEIEGSGYAADSSIPAGAIVTGLLGEIAVVALLSALFLRKLAKTPPLSLLQENYANAAKAKPAKKRVSKSPVADYAPAQINSAAQISAPAVNINISEALPKRGYPALWQVWGYIFRHMRRTGWKTAIAFTLAFVLMGAIGVVALTKSNYEEMFRRVDVKSAVNHVTYNHILRLSESDLVGEIFLSGYYTVTPNNTGDFVNWIMTNDVNRYLTGAFKSEFSPYSIEYADGYSDGIFAADILSENAVCVIGSNVAEAYGLALGDDLLLMDYESFHGVKSTLWDPGYRKIVASLHAGEFETEEEFQAIMERVIESDIEKATVSYEIAGIISSADNDIAGAAYTPPGKAAEFLHTCGGKEEAVARLPVDFTETILSDNERVDEINALLDEMVSVSTGEYSSWFGGAPSYYTDTTELDNVRRVRDLLVMLFPIVAAAAVLIGAAAPALIIIQSAKEAAIMRVLGATKRRVLCILAFEQIILCVIGLVIAAGGLLLYNAALFAQSAQTLAICGVLYLLGYACAALAASVSVTGQKVLELLQVKE